MGSKPLRIRFDKTDDGIRYLVLIGSGPKDVIYNRIRSKKVKKVKIL